MLAVDLDLVDEEGRAVAVTAQQLVREHEPDGPVVVERDEEVDAWIGEQVVPLARAGIRRERGDDVVVTRTEPADLRRHVE